MDRREFLKFVGMGFAALAGVSSIMKTLAHINSASQQATTQTAHSAYAGKQNAFLG
jgi:hypothetical protein